MVEIENEEVFGQVIADAVASIGINVHLTSFERIRATNAVAKATVRIQTSGAFMDYDAERNALLIWSDSNEIYDLKDDGRCQCMASMNGKLCWHRAAKRLLSNYEAALSRSARVTQLRSNLETSI